MNSNSIYLVKVEWKNGVNNNKYYKMIKDGDGFNVEYGRIGVTKQTTSYPMSRWNSTYKSKIKKGYVDQTHLVAEEIKKSPDKEFSEIENKIIAEIVDRLQSMAKQAIKDNYTISSNSVTQNMIDEAQKLLTELLECDILEKFNEVLLELFKTIPRKMKRVGDNLAKNDSDYSGIIQKEQNLLDVMKGQVVQNVVVDEETKDITDKPTKTILDTMGLVFEEVTNTEVENIKKLLGSISDKYYRSWRVTNTNTQKKFDEFVKDNNISDVKMLFHGSRNENWWNIINTGLVLRPQAKVTGKMFGYGIYFAPKAKKSLGYTSLIGSYWAGGSSNSAFMSLFDVAYGKPYDVYSFQSRLGSFDYNKLQQASSGANCLHAHSGSMLRNDEIIVYKEEQLTIKYLVELR